MPDVRYIPEIDYARSNWKPLGEPPGHFCDRCVLYYKNLNKEGIDIKNEITNEWSIRCQGDKSKALESISREVLEAIPEKERQGVLTALDPVEWAKVNLGIIPYWYQAEILRCTSQFKVVRAGRRSGKSETLCMDIWHKAYTKCGKDVNRYVILVVCPYEAQVKMIFDNLLAIKNRSPVLMESFAGSTQAPWEIRLMNGSVIKGYSAAKSSSARSNKIRGQGANHLYFDEVDYMADDDIETVLAVLVDQPDTTVWMSSTPTGLRAKFYQFCTMKAKGFKEFHFISAESPRWTPTAEKVVRETYSQGGYDREFNAEFGVETSGVFRPGDLDACLAKYKYQEDEFDTQGKIKPARKVPNTKIVIGVDWNKHTGTHIVVLEGGVYDTKDFKGPMYRVLDKKVIRRTDFTQHQGVEAVIAMDKKWKADFIYVDEGYGAMQVEALWRHDKNNPQEDLQYRRRIVQIHGNEVIEIPDPRGGPEPIRKNAKPFMIDTLAHWVELGIFKVPGTEDTHTALVEKEIPFLNIGLVQQMREFRIEKYSPTGIPRYSQGYEHTLMALCFAVMGMVLRFSELKRQISPDQVIYSPTPFGLEVVKDKDQHPVDVERADKISTAELLKPGRTGLPETQAGLREGYFKRQSSLGDLGRNYTGMSPQTGHHLGRINPPNRRIP